jgi:hypothetical protein
MAAKKKTNAQTRSQARAKGAHAVHKSLKAGGAKNYEARRKASAIAVTQYDKSGALLTADMRDFDQKRSPRKKTAPKAKSPRSKSRSPKKVK